MPERAKKPFFKKGKEVQAMRKNMVVLAYIFLLMLANAVALITTFAVYTLGPQVKHSLPGYVLLVSAIVSILNIAFLIALAQLRKWGLWGYTFCTLFGIAFMIVVMDYPTNKTLLSLVGLLALYGLLHVGGKKKLWNKLQ